MRQASALLADEIPANTLAIAAIATEKKDSADTQFSDYKIIRRNGSVAPFAPDKIAIALTKAFIAVNGGQEAASARMREIGRAHV